MTLHANRGLYHRAVFQARQDKKGGAKSSSSSASPRTTNIALKDTPLPVTPTSSSSSFSSSFSSSSTPVVVRTTTTPKAYTSVPVNKANTLPTTSSPIPDDSSVSTTPSSAPATDAASSSPSGGTVAGGIIGALLAIAAIVFIAIFVIRRTRRRRDRLNDAHFFNKEKLERPSMVQGLAAGPGVYPTEDYHHQPYPRPPSPNYPAHYVEKNLPPAPFPSDSPHMSNPFSPAATAFPGSPFNSNEGGEQDFGAPPIPGIDGPASYSSYRDTRPNQTTPPGSPFAGGHAMQDPFLTPPPPSSNSRRLSTPFTPVGPWPRTPVGPGSFMPLLPGGAFGTDGFRDSGYSAMCSSEAHVGQAYKVQVEVSRPKYEDLTRGQAENDNVTPSTPPPPFTPFDPAMISVDDPLPPVPVDSAPAMADSPVLPDSASATADSPLQVACAPATTNTPSLPRPPSSQTVYNSEDAYGGL